MSFLVGGALAIGGASATTILAGAGIGAMVGKTIMGGAGAQTKGERDEQLGYAKEMYQEQLGLLGEQRGTAVSGANLGMAAAQSQFAGGQRDVTMGAQIGMRDIKTAGENIYGQAGLVSGTAEQKTKTQTGDLMAKYKSDMTKLFETKQIAGQQRDLSINKATLAFRQGELSAEDAYESMKTEIESQPTGFLEGMFS